MSCPLTLINLGGINMKRYRKLLIALLAVASLYIVRETGLDAGLIDAIMDGIVEALPAGDPVEVQ